jgi:hypothetical protein
MWRFGQTHPVRVDVITTEGGRNVLANLIEAWETNNREQILTAVKAVEKLINPVEAA